MARFIRWLIRQIPWLSADYRRRIKPTQKCVACGDTGRKTMRYDPLDRLVRMECGVCQAAWAYDPLINAAQWSKPIEE